MPVMNEVCMNLSFYLHQYAMQKQQDRQSLIWNCRKYYLWFLLGFSLSLYLGEKES